ncbi:MAG: D-Ala-D-Ala carboxypeptidase family metallohydrolase [Pseudomonadota bacterium]
MLRRILVALVLGGMLAGGLVYWQRDQLPPHLQVLLRNLIDPPAGHPPRLTEAYAQAVNAYLAQEGITRFTARDIAVLGAGSTSLYRTTYGMNDHPPLEAWERILPTLRVLEAFLARCACEIEVISSYRNERYNTALGSATRSQHLRFTAIDFIASTGTPEDWRGILIALRNEGLFRGGIGVYPSFVHVDTRGTNADWDQR